MDRRRNTLGANLERLNNEPNEDDLEEDGKREGGIQSQDQASNHKRKRDGPEEQKTKKSRTITSQTRTRKRMSEESDGRQEKRPAPSPPTKQKPRSESNTETELLLEPKRGKRKTYREEGEHVLPEYKRYKAPQL